MKQKGKVLTVFRLEGGSGQEAQREEIGNSTVYVSSGLSLWGPPFRIGTDSEMVVFNITFKE